MRILAAAAKFMNEEKLIEYIVYLDAKYPPKARSKTIANFLINDLQGWLNKEKLDWNSEVIVGDFSQLISPLSAMVLDGKITKKDMKRILREKFEERLKSISLLTENEV